jgi:hypothetical protein
LPARAAACSSVDPSAGSAQSTVTLGAGCIAAGRTARVHCRAGAGQDLRDTKVAGACGAQQRRAMRGVERIDGRICRQQLRSRV